jgi:hypothetical protein
MAGKNKYYEKVGRDYSGKGKIKCTSLVFSVGSEEIPYNLPTIKLNTILNFNEKIFVKIPFYNRLWLNLNGGEWKKSKNKFKIGSNGGGNCKKVGKQRKTDVESMASVRCEKVKKIDERQKENGTVLADKASPPVFRRGSMDNQIECGEKK